MSYVGNLIVWVGFVCNELSDILAWRHSLFATCVLCITLHCVARCTSRRASVQSVASPKVLQRGNNSIDWTSSSAVDGPRLKSSHGPWRLLSEILHSPFKSSCSGRLPRDAERVLLRGGRSKRGIFRKAETLRRCRMCEDPAEVIRLGIAPTGAKPTESNTPQFAAVVFNGKPPAIEKVMSEQERIFSGPEHVDVVRERLNSTLIEAGGMIAARLPKKAKGMHAESLLVDRLEKEPISLLIALSPICFYSSLCPCHSCARRIAAFAASTPPEVQVQLAYNYVWVPDEYAKFKGGISDSSSVALLRNAGVEVRKLRDEWGWDKNA